MTRTRPQSTMCTPKLNNRQRPHSGLPGTDSVYLSSWAPMLRMPMLPSFLGAKFRSKFCNEATATLSAHPALGLSNGLKCGTSPTFHIKMQTDPAAETVCHFFLFFHCFSFILLDQYCSGDQIEKNEMEGACGTYGEVQRCIKGCGRET